MVLLGIDIGTTHCKAGLFNLDGTAKHIASRPTITHRTADGQAYFEPQELWDTAADVIREAAAAKPGAIAAIGIASMAETGLLVNRYDGTPRSRVIPWFDTTAQPQADALTRDISPFEVYVKTGLRVTFKCSLAKLLWLREGDPAITRDAIWLSAADYIAFRLTQSFGTDYSLAGRTCAFDIHRKTWDAEWLRTWGISPDIFPPAMTAGTPVGKTTSQWDALGIPAGIPVGVCGHDHVCATLAVGAVKPGLVFDSMGTAEALIGTFQERPLTEADFEAGLAVGCHVVRGQHYWMGGLSASGGSLEWLRAQLGAEPLSYADLLDLLAAADPDPTGILFFPYLLGSGTPHSDPLARGAWVGLRAVHGRADLAKSVLEGTAYEMEWVRRTGEQVSGLPIEQMTIAGGGTRNPVWLQIKADVSGCWIQVSPEPEATLLGAALAAGIGSGVYASVDEAVTATARQPIETLKPDRMRHDIYRALFEGGYLSLQNPLRGFSRINLPDG